MEGISPTQPFRGPNTKPMSIPAPAPSGWNAGLGDVLTLGTPAAVSSAAAVKPMALPPTVGRTPNAAELIEQVAAALATDPAPAGLEAARLQTFAAVVLATAKNPESTRLLALALKPPPGNEGADRLHRLLFEADDVTLGQLYYTTAMDTEEFATLQKEFPENIFDAKLTGGMVLSDVLADMYAPESIVQGDKLTCGPACVQIMLAREAPAEYMRLVSGLAIFGSVSLKMGQSIERESDWKATNDGGRRLTSRLLQPAFMEFANGDDVYHNTADRSYPSDMSGEGRQGLPTAELQRLLTAATGLVTTESQVKIWDTSALGKWVPDPEVDLTIKMEEIKAMSDRGQSVPVLLSIKPDQKFSHFQLVTRVEDKKVFGLNPWGKEEPMERWLFESRLIAAFIQDK